MIEIQNLQVKHNDLERHKEEYQEKIAELEIQKSKQKEKMSMVHDLLKQLDADRKKVVYLSFICLFIRSLSF